MISFDGFLTSLGHPSPYSWQERFAQRCADGEPPSVIAVPTGAGKTTAVDALVWALARQADLPAAERTVGVRIVWAIDRRILVDEVHEHACEVAYALAAAEEGPLREVADRLRKLAGPDAPPLVATRWRGGIDDPSELYGPLQPQIITSTVGQIGSRLLFRGYGVSERSLALETGLAACDTTICLDEAHLSEPFRQTVEAIRQRREAADASVALPSLRTITITATPRQNGGDAIQLDEADRRHPELARRLSGAKWAVLAEPAGTTDKERVAALVDATLSHVREGADTVACVVNTVRRARDVHKALKAALAKEEGAPACELLIGPQRPVDRAELLRQHGDKLFRRHGAESGRLVVVTTQTFEVGLDADVEAMVTESASASALVQRLGRLNRRGDRVGRATIVRDDQTWLYEDDEPNAWAWLRSRESDGVIDVSLVALEREPKPPASLRTVDAPGLTDEIVDLLTHTSRDVGRWQEIDVEVYWRGAEARPGADVAVCWRADLRPDLAGNEADRYRAALLELVPPQREELLTLTVNAARALIAARYHGAGGPAAGAKLTFADADVEGETPATRLPEPASTVSGLPFVVLRGDETLRGGLRGDGAADTVLPSAIRPGDVVVLPAIDTSIRGLADLGSDDAAADIRGSTAPVPVRLTPEALSVGREKLLHVRRWSKVARACRAAEREIAEARSTATRAERLAGLVETLRKALPDHAGLRQLSPATLADVRCHLVLRRVGPVDVEDAPDDDEDDAAEEAIDVAVAQEPEHPDEETADDDAGAVAPDRPLEPGWVLVPISDRRRERDERTTAGDEPPPTLDAHARAVERQVLAYATTIGLSEPIAAALSLAARAHDHGKGDSRMQRFFRRGVDPLGTEPIAKSEFGTRNRRVARIARAASGLPTGLHHEISSVALLEGAFSSGLLELNGLDPDLILRLIGGHHGLGTIPRVPERNGVPARTFHVEAAGIAGTARGDGQDGWANGAWLERFGAVNGRYGAWNVAYLQSLLMLADRVVSSKGG